MLLFFQLLYLIFLLAFIGEPIRKLFSKFTGLTKNLDILQIVILNVYLGGLLLYIIAITPLNLFRKDFLYFTTASLSTLSVIIHRKKIVKLTSCLKNRKKLQRSLFKNKIRVLEIIFVTFFFLASFWMQISPLSNFVFGSVQDTSLHSLMVQVLLERGEIPATVQPYLPEGIVYPQASHVLFGYSSLALGYITPKAVFYGTPLFNALSVFAAYFLGKKLWNRSLFYMSLSFITAFTSSWPLYITWGANPFVVGFPLFLICIGFLFSIKSTNKKEWVGDIVFVGILAGYSAAIMISFLQTFLVISFFWFLARWVQRGKRNILFFLTLLAVSLIPLTPFIYRFFSFYSLPGHNMGLPSDVVEMPSQQESLAQPICWFLNFLSPSTTLSFETKIILLTSLFLLFIAKKQARVVALVSSTIFCSAFLLTILSYTLIPSLNLISWAHQAIIFSVSTNILIAIFNVVLVYNIKRFFKRIRIKLRFRDKKLAYSSLVFLTLTLIYLPFIHFRFSEEAELLSGSYGVFAITSEEDYELMLWMKANVTKDAVILVNPYESGLFIPSVANLKAVFPTPGSRLSRSYTRLMSLTWQNVFNNTTYELLNHFNITHVFIGSYATYWWEDGYKWDPFAFLNNTKFVLIKNIGNSFLFEFTEN